MFDFYFNSCFERIIFNIICMCIVEMEKKLYEMLFFFFVIYDMNMSMKYWFFSIRLI